MSETSSGCFGCVHLVGLWSTEQTEIRSKCLCNIHFYRCFCTSSATVITSIFFLIFFLNVRAIKCPSCSLSCSVSVLKPKYFCCCGMWSIFAYLTCIFLTLQRACEIYDLGCLHVTAFPLLACFRNY